MLRPALLLLLALPLAACGGGSGTNFSLDATSDEGNTHISTDANGQVAINLPGITGSVKLPKFNVNAENFEVNGVKLYPGSQISGIHVNADDSGGDKDGKVSLTFASPAAPAKVQAYLLDAMAKKGFKVEARGSGLSGTTDDGKPIRVELSAEGSDKAKGSMQVGG